MITEHHTVVFYSDKTNCEYKTKKEAMREELRTELTDEIMTEIGGLDRADVGDILTYVLNKFPCMYMPKGTAQ